MDENRRTAAENLRAARDKFNEALVAAWTVGLEVDFAPTKTGEIRFNAIEHRTAQRY